METYHTVFLELYAAFVTLDVWGHELSNSTIRFYCDNKLTVGILRKQSSDSPVMMALVRHIVLICMIHNILLDARHIQDIDN